MGVEGGGYHGYEGNGNIESNREKISWEVEFDQANSVYLPPTILNPVCRFEFQKVGRYLLPKQFGASEQIELYSAQLFYRNLLGEKHTSNLSDVVSEQKPVYFTGSDGFYAYDPLMVGQDTPFYIVGLEPNTLQQKVSGLFSAYHELGHIIIFDNDFDIQLLQAAITRRKAYLPAVAQSTAYAINLSRALKATNVYDTEGYTVTREDQTELSIRRTSIDKAVRLFHERNAWAAGLHLARREEYPLGGHFSHYFDHSQNCLSTYDRYYGGNQFTRGIK